MQTQTFEHIFDVMFHSLGAWGTLTHLAASLIVWAKPHPSLASATDGKTIWIDPTLTEAETRYSLMHESIHVEWGHEGCQPGTIEREVCLETARRLISFTDLQRVASWAKTPCELAEELGVTEQVVIDRLQILSGDEIQELWPPSEYHA